MARLLSILVACIVPVFAALPASEKKTSPVRTEVTSVELDFPDGTGASSPGLTRAPDGTVWLIWLERALKGHAVLCAPFDPALRRWSAARTLATGPAVAAPDATAPVLAAGAGGRLAAVWAQITPGPQSTAVLYTSASRDAGLTWSPPVPLTSESAATAAPALTFLADGRLLAAWLDRRGRALGDRNVRLYARIVSEPGAPDVLLEPRVSERCAPALGAFPDGGAILSYRSLDDGGVRDIRVVRFNAGQWAEDRVLNDDRWRVAESPGEGPRLAVAGGRIAAAWFTGADYQARVQISTSSDAGLRFLMPLTLDFGRPLGFPAVTLLHDGAVVALWREDVSSERNARPGGLWLRRASPAYSFDPPVLLAAAAARPLVGSPRIAIVRDFAGGDGVAELLVAYTTRGEGSRVHTLLVTVPEGALLAAAAECGCAPTADEALGYPLRGAFTALDPARDEVTVKHGQLPGLLPDGPTVFKVAPGVFASAQVGRDFLGRVELQEGRWRLFNIRLLVAPPARK